MVCPAWLKVPAAMIPHPALVKAVAPYGCRPLGSVYRVSSPRASKVLLPEEHAPRCPLSLELGHDCVQEMLWPLNTGHYRSEVFRLGKALSCTLRRYFLFPPVFLDSCEQQEHFPKAPDALSPYTLCSFPSTQHYTHVHTHAHSRTGEQGLDVQGEERAHTEMPVFTVSAFSMRSPGQTGSRDNYLWTERRVLVLL